MKNKLRCWFSGHKPDFSKCETIEIPTSEDNIGNFLIIRHGRTLHIGETNCTRCGRALYVEGAVVETI